MKKTGFSLLELVVVLLLLIVLAGVVLPFTQGTVEQTTCQVTDATLAAVKQALMGTSGPGYFSDLGKRLPYYRAGSGNADCADDSASGGDPHYHLHFLFKVSTTGPASKSLCPKSLHRFRPQLVLGWRGPYLANGGAKLADPIALDATFNDLNYVHFKHQDHPNDLYVLDHYRWHHPIVLQVPSDTTCSALGYSDGSWCARLVSAGPNGRLDTQLNDAKALNRGDDRVLFVRIPDPNPQGNLPCAR